MPDRQREKRPHAAPRRKVAGGGHGRALVFGKKHCGRVFQRDGGVGNGKQTRQKGEVRFVALHRELTQAERPDS